MALNLIIVELH